VYSYVEQEIVSTIESPVEITIGLFCIADFAGWKMILRICKRNKVMVMKFLLVVLAIRYVFRLLNRISKKKEHEEDWSSPSEHNVWW
jgi:hypothetical protein